MRFSVVTPCYNAASYIEETVASISGQAAVRNGGVELEHLVCDGASTDGTLDILRRLQQPHLRVSSQKDGGMYEAMARGLQAATGDVVICLNAGDYLHPHAFSVVRDVMSAHPGCRWLTGWAVQYSATGAAVRLEVPYRYRRRLHLCGGYGRFLPAVQQESTFFRRELLQRVDFERLARLRLAGDYYLWRCFAGTDELHVVSAHLGGFRLHPGQLTTDHGPYMKEMDGLTDPPGALDYALAAVDRLLWYAPPRVKQWLNPAGFHLYDHRSGRWL